MVDDVSFDGRHIIIIANEGAMKKGEG